MCVCPNPAIDHTVVLPEITGEETIRSLASLSTAGGKGLNVARFAGGFGVSASAVTWLGETGAEMMFALARRDGLSLRASIASGMTVRVCPVLVLQNDGAAVTVADPAPLISGRSWSEFVDMAASAAQEADAVCVAGSFPRVTGIEPVGALLNAIGSSVPVWVDTSGSALTAAAVIDGPSLKINLAEARDLLGSDLGPRSAPAADQALAAVQALGRAGRDVVVTAGRAGAASSTASGLRWLESPTVDAMNPTASGDAFMAGYLCAGRGRLADIGDPLQAAVLAGAANAQSWTPTAPAEAVLSLARRRPNALPGVS